MKYDKPLIAAAIGAISTIPYEIFTRIRGTCSVTYDIGKEYAGENRKALLEAKPLSGMSSISVFVSFIASWSSSELRVMFFTSCVEHSIQA